jgi:hypothetical protein
LPVAFGAGCEGLACGCGCCARAAPAVVAPRTLAHVTTAKVRSGLDRRMGFTESHANGDGSNFGRFAALAQNVL